MTKGASPIDPMPVVSESSDSRPPSIEKASVINVFSSLVARGLNFLAFSVLIAYFFGANAATDAFTLGALVPIWIHQLVLYGLNSCFVPVFVAEQRDLDDGYRIAAGFGRLSYGAMLLVLLLGIGMAPVLVNLSIPAGSVIPRSDATYYARSMFGLLALAYPAAFFSSFFYARRRYIPPALGHIVYGAGLVTGLVALHGQQGLSSLVTGMGVGLVLQLAVLAAFLKGDLKRLLVSYDLAFSDVRVRRIFGLLIPVAIGGSLYPVFLLATRAAAATVGEGAVASLDFGSRTVIALSNLIGTGVGLAVLPKLSSSLVDRPQEVSALVNRSARTLSLPMIPLGVGLGILSSYFVQVVFYHGALSDEGATMVRTVILFLSPIILLEPLNTTLTYLMFSQRNTWKLLRCTGAGLICGLMVVFPLTSQYGLGGVALSIVVGLMCQVIALGLALARSLGSSVILGALRPYLLVIGCALPGASILWAGQQMAAVQQPWGISAYAVIVLTVLLAATVYLAFIRLLWEKLVA